MFPCLVNLVIVVADKNLRSNDQGIIISQNAMLDLKSLKASKAFSHPILFNMLLLSGVLNADVCDLSYGTLIIA